MNPSMRRGRCALRHATYASEISRLAKFEIVMNEGVKPSGAPTTRSADPRTRRRDSSRRSGPRRRALELGSLRLLEHDLLDECRDALLLGMGSERSRLDGSRVCHGK